MIKIITAREYEAARRLVKTLRIDLRHSNAERADMARERVRLIGRIDELGAQLKTLQAQLKTLEGSK